MVKSNLCLRPKFILDQNTFEFRTVWKLKKKIKEAYFLTLLLSLKKNSNYAPQLSNKLLKYLFV